MFKENKFLVLFLFFTISFFYGVDSYAQKSRAELEREKKENLKKIEEANRILEETKTKKTNTIGELNAIDSRIKTSEKQLSLINDELQLLDREIVGIEKEMNSLQVNLQALKKEYASMVYAAAKANRGYDRLTYIFASSTFHELVMRIKYMSQYSQARRDQISHIINVSAELKQRTLAIQYKKSQKQGLKRVEQSENHNLHHLRTKQSEVVKELSKKERQIQDDIESNKRALRRLENLIADMVRREIERSRNAANKSDSKTDRIALTPEGVALSANFAENRARLPWPVKHGFISQVFGRQPHPVLKGVMVENLGIDIQTNNKELVTAVFKGKVTAVASVPGMGNVVMIQHGEYFTVYAKLRSVNVKEGQKINAKDVIGTVSSDKDDVSELQFQIWKNSEKMDPENWLLSK